MFAHIIMTNFSCKKEKKDKLIKSLQITCKYDTSYNFGRVKYCIDSFFLKSKFKKSIYNDKENQYEKKPFSVKQRVYEFLFVSYSYSRKNIYNM